MVDSWFTASPGLSLTLELGGTQDKPAITTHTRHCHESMLHLLSLYYLAISNKWIYYNNNLCLVSEGPSKSHLCGVWQGTIATRLSVNMTHMSILLVQRPYRLFEETSIKWLPCCLVDICFTVVEVKS